MPLRLLLIPLLPFAGFLVNASFGRRVTKGTSGAVACGTVIASFLVSCVAVWNLVALEPEARLIVRPTFDWIRSGNLDVGFTLALDPFAAVMLVLVLGANFLVLFVGWEGVGLCSYLLIGFWFEKKSAADAGKKAFIVNRIGDVGFILGVLLTFTRFGTVDFQ